MESKKTGLAIWLSSSLLLSIHYLVNSKKRGQSQYLLGQKKGQLPGLMRLALEAVAGFHVK